MDIKEYTEIRKTHMRLLLNNMTIEQHASYPKYSALSEEERSDLEAQLQPLMWSCLSLLEEVNKEYGDAK